MRIAIALLAFIFGYSDRSISIVHPWSDRAKYFFVKISHLKHEIWHIIEASTASTVLSLRSSDRAK
ncbi:MAG: hypothetical protein J7647_01480 [Cyanobacteria bacterium SBLK]|nr:hypothetical protein [Cyanobacteria bacterium SBLK]